MYLPVNVMVTRALRCNGARNVTKRKKLQVMVYLSATRKPLLIFAWRDEIERGAVTRPILLANSPATVVRGE